MDVALAKYRPGNLMPLRQELLVYGMIDVCVICTVRSDIRI